MLSAPRSQTISPASTMRNGRSRHCAGGGLSRRWSPTSPPPPAWVPCARSPVAEPHHSAETLERLPRVITSTPARLGPTAACLGEVIVHGQDIRRPLTLLRT